MAVKAHIITVSGREHTLIIETYKPAHEIVNDVRVACDGRFLTIGTTMFVIDQVETMAFTEA